MKKKILRLVAIGFAAGFGLMTLSAVGAPEGEGTGLSRDGQRKWPVPAKMKVHLAKVEKAVRTGPSGADADHAARAATIQEELRAFISSCTMDGPAHEQLHRWLVPFLQLAERHAKATTPGERDATQRELQRALEIFHAYFE